MKTDNFMGKQDIIFALMKPSLLILKEFVYPFINGISIEIVANNMALGDFFF
jgi:hypothetical protein